MQEHYYELTLKISSNRELFSDFLADTLPVGFEEIDDGFIIRSEDELDTIIWGVEQFREALQKALGINIEIEYFQKKLKNSDWVKLFQESIKPLEIDKFYIYPVWDNPNPEMINIAINPAMAFGTGHHPTTASVLRAVAKYVKNGNTVLDVGCGSGILSIAAIKMGATVDACDTDELSIANSIENAGLNGVSYNQIWEGSASLAEQKYNVVIANIVADVLTFIANDLKNALKEGGILILSGILDKYEAKVLKFYKEFEIIEKIAQEEWVTLILRMR